MTKMIFFFLSQSWGSEEIKDNLCLTLKVQHVGNVSWTVRREMLACAADNMKKVICIQLMCAARINTVDTCKVWALFSPRDQGLTLIECRWSQTQTEPNWFRLSCHIRHHPRPTAAGRRTGQLLTYSDSLCGTVTSAWLVIWTPGGSPLTAAFSIV